MSYIPLSEYPKAWIFRHKDLPLSEEDLAGIRPLTESRSNQLWGQQISQYASHPDYFEKGDWPADGSVWQETGRWQEAWDSQEPQLPELLNDHIEWEDNTVVWFCYESDHVIETTWGIFKRAWKNFLFMDDGPLLIGRRRKQTAQFFQNGNVKVGTRK
ncbi:DUF2947 domain-containing protein [Marinobacterium jannaschii]|uniref:DUF2947 domain-containing protein n=1 Tax=Marinobacterium jannaschii TaxID=64970 RepID=UPI0004887F0C|nr:DUF2947 domain-containing protein [Marinobacterium jannaschii]